MVTLALCRKLERTLIGNVDLKNEDEILITLETGNEICIVRDEQGDVYVEIDGDDVCDNSNRIEEQGEP